MLQQPCVPPMVDPDAARPEARAVAGLDKGQAVLAKQRPQIFERHSGLIEMLDYIEQRHDVVGLVAPYRQRTVEETLDEFARQVPLDARKAHHVERGSPPAGFSASRKQFATCRPDIQEVERRTSFQFP